MTLSNVFATLAVLDELSGPGLEVALAVSLRTECEYDARHFVRPKVRTGDSVLCPALDEMHWFLGGDQYIHGPGSLPSLVN